MFHKICKKRNARYVIIGIIFHGKHLVLSCVHSTAPSAASGQQNKQMTITLKNVRVHNLKSVNLTLEKGSLICFTGVSGSGKSSLAFDTLYIEGQRRYVESLSQHVRRFLGELPKPDLDSITGITPTISIEQKTSGKNPRSTVGTITEIYDYLRVLYARAGIAYCPVSHERVSARSRDDIISEVQKTPPPAKLIILAPYLSGKKGELLDDFEAIAKKGFTRVRLDGTIQLLTDTPKLEKMKSHDLDIVVDRIDISGTQSRERIAESITYALEIGQNRCLVLDYDTRSETLYSTTAYSPQSGLSYPPLDPQDFSFNSPQGMCPECQGLGIKHEYVLDRIIDPNKSIAEDCCSIASSYKTVRYGNIYDNLARIYGFSVHTPWNKLSDEAKKVFLHGTERKWTRMHFVHPVTGAMWNDIVWWRGALNEAYDRYQKAKSDGYKRKQEALMQGGICYACKGARIKPYPAACEFHKKTIHELTEMPIGEVLTFLESIILTEQEELLAKELLREVKTRLSFLVNVGLDYLQLSRTQPTLSGGESQRVRLASQIGSGLVGITYVLDEPSIGLHPVDNEKLIASLKGLRDKNNTVIVVEHDEETICAADHIVDFGPKAGLHGGQIIFSGPLSGLLKNKESLTAAFLSGRRSIPTYAPRQAANEFLTLTGARHNNVHNAVLQIPLSRFVAVTGVSGSGKSSLLLETLYPALANKLMNADLRGGSFDAIENIKAIDKVIEIDQSPIGRTPRSNPATYVGVFDEIRALYAKLPQAAALGYKAGRFSFNVQEGSCPECHGMGLIKVDMDFLEEAWIECSVCHGLRFDEETLAIRYKEKNIHDVLEMSIQEAISHFEHIPHIVSKLRTLERVGLDYMKLGQSSTTLSGGEAQRIKLARELCRPATGKTLYLLDEPTTGLHFYDLTHLLEVLHALVDKGNTVVVIEHNMDLVKTADWIIDMGPSSGKQGGKIIATGTVAQIAQEPSATGKALKAHLEKRGVVAKKPQKRKLLSQNHEIVVSNAAQNNLQHVDVQIPRGMLCAVTGPSGSGKSSLAFETIYATGQRRYVESLSPYIRQFVKQCPKPKVDDIQGLTPSVAIEQRLHATNPRSTVGTMTEIYDYLRILYSRIGIPHCPQTGYEIRAISKEHVVEKILSFPANEKLHILAPLEIKRAETPSAIFAKWRERGFLRVRLNSVFYELNEDTIPYDPKRKNELFLVVDRVVVGPAMKMRLFEAVQTAASIGNNKVTVMRPEGDVFFNLSFAVVETGQSYPEITPHSFAFNTPLGMCPDCQGLGYQVGFDIRTLFQDITVKELLSTLSGSECSASNVRFFEQVMKDFDIDPKTILSKLPEAKKHILFNGSQKPLPSGIVWLGFNEGITRAIQFTHEGEDRIPEEWLEAMRQAECPSCHGDRLNPLARAVTLSGTSIVQACRLSIEKMISFLEGIAPQVQGDIALKEVYDECHMRLTFLDTIGLGYLDLWRGAATLSGGEAERVRLAKQIGSGLTEVLYVLDEPTIGLHPHDTHTLMKALKKLLELGNTLLVVEHDPQLIAMADRVIELGPGSGKHGGHIMHTGTPKELMETEGSLTGKYLLPQKVPQKVFATKKEKTKKRKQEMLSIRDVTCYNLNSFSVDIPLHGFVCLTGVSGSGKSTLLYEVIQKDFESGKLNNTDIAKTIIIDQRPIGNTLRSDVATYIDVLTPMRSFFAALPEARIHGLQPKHFSCYHRSGMCTTCWGLGYKKVTMHFLPPVKISCPDCKGLRLNKLSLSVHYQNKNLGEILQLTVEEARTLFVNHPRIVHLLDVLISVGLGYLTLGQEMHTLSGGEAQRMKFSYEISKRAKGHTLYLIDEPTTGLHGQEVEKIIACLVKLVHQGHSVIAIEHNLDFIAAAEHIIDLGPGAGDKGGKIVCQGSLDEILQNKTSLTARYLRQRLFPEL